MDHTPHPPPKARKMQTLNLAFLASATGGPGDEGWHPLKKEEVPEWIRDDPDMLLKIAYGDMVRKGEGTWYRAVRLPLPGAANDAPANDEGLPPIIVGLDPAAGGDVAAAVAIEPRTGQVLYELEAQCMALREQCRFPNCACPRKRVQ